jgi:hypothetical protein
MQVFFNAFHERLRKYIRVSQALLLRQFRIGNRSDANIHHDGKTIGRLKKTRNTNTSNYLQKKSPLIINDESHSALSSILLPGSALDAILLDSAFERRGETNGT